MWFGDGDWAEPGSILDTLYNYDAQAAFLVEVLGLDFKKFFDSKPLREFKHEGNPYPWLEFEGGLKMEKALWDKAHQDFRRYGHPFLEEWAMRCMMLQGEDVWLRFDTWYRQQLDKHELPVVK